MAATANFFQNFLPNISYFKILNFKNELWNFWKTLLTLKMNLKDFECHFKLMASSSGFEWTFREKKLLFNFNFYIFLPIQSIEDAICVSQRSFAIAIAIAGLVLMLLVVLAALCIMARRSRKTHSSSGSSIYSGPYTNTAFSHTS